MTLNPSETHEPQTPADLFVEFANTLEYSNGQPADAIPDVAALLAWLTQHGLLSDRARGSELQRLLRDPEESERRMERFRHLRHVLHVTSNRVAGSGQPTRTQLRDLNHILRHGVHYHQLRLDPDAARYTVAQVGDALDQARSSIAGSFAHFLAEESRDRLRICADEGCRYLFLDHSPTGRRRWCDMRTCGNRAKVARHRARARTASGTITTDAG